MNYDQLSLILEVAETGSLSGTARRLYITQPTISKMLRSVEDELGFTIFERSKTGMTPTPAGRVFLDYAQETLQKLRTLQANAGSSISAGNHSLSVVTNGLELLRYIFLDVVVRHQDELDLMRYLVANLSDSCSLVASGMVELGVLMLPEAAKKTVIDHLNACGLHSTELGSLPLAVEVSSANPLFHFSGTPVDTALLSQFRPAYPYEENPVFSRMFSDMAIELGCTLEPYCPRLYGDDEYLRLRENSMLPDPCRLQLYAYSDWSRHIYNPDEVRFVADSTLILRRMGKKPAPPAGIGRLTLKGVERRFLILGYCKQSHTLSSMESRYIEELKRLITL